MGIESDTATGWPATDWFEALVAKYGGEDGYNSVGHPRDASSTPTWSARRPPSSRS